jgi:hypothetical protein
LFYLSYFYFSFPSSPFCLGAYVMFSIFLTVYSIPFSVTSFPFLLLPYHFIMAAVGATFPCYLLSQFLKFSKIWRTEIQFGT